MNIHWKEWGWNWSSNTLATWSKELTYLKRPWCWQRLGAGGERDDRGWDGWMASPTPWTWVWVNSRSWWWTGRLACCSPWGRKESDMTKWLNWTELTIQTFVGKVMSSLLLNMLSRFVIAFLPRSKHLLILWLQSPPTAILEPKKRSAMVSTFYSSICCEVMICR